MIFNCKQNSQQMPAKISQGWIDNVSKVPFLSHKWIRKVKKPAHRVKVTIIPDIKCFSLLPAHFCSHCIFSNRKFQHTDPELQEPLEKSAQYSVLQIWEGSWDTLCDLLQDKKLVNVEQGLKCTFPDFRILADANKPFGIRLSPKDKLSTKKKDISKGKALHFCQL